MKEILNIILCSVKIAIFYEAKRKISKIPTINISTLKTHITIALAILFKALALKNNIFYEGEINIIILNTHPHPKVNAIIALKDRQIIQKTISFLPATLYDVEQ